MTITIHRTERQKLIDVSAIESTQGGRRVYTFTLTCRELDNIIEPRTRQDVIQEANRRYDSKHAATIQQYLFEKQDWVLGAELVAIDPNAIVFKPYPDPQGQPTSVGRMVVYMDDKNLLRLFDGQHRRGAIANVIKDDFEGSLATLKRELADLRDEVAETEDITATKSAIHTKEEQIRELESKKERFEHDSLTIILYAEGELSAVRQMFSDAANAKPQEPITRARFDQRDAFNLAAFELSNSSQLLKGKIDMERSAVSQTSESLISFSQLATMLKTLEFGYYGRISKTRNAELLADYSEVVNCGIDFFDEFLPAAIEEFDLLLGEEMTSEDIPDRRQISFALNVTVLRVLAGCYHAWGTGNRQTLIDFLRAQHFDKGRHRNAILVKSGLVVPGANTPQARRQEVQGAIRYIIDAAREYQRS
ncbi:MAG: hypothetical protein OXF79_22770 [Chloroflexi bacterium]|nr:hypothetical protein [Chloroflexota bacterium]